MNLSNITSELHLFKYYQQTQLEETASYILQAIYETPVFKGFDTPSHNRGEVTVAVMGGTIATQLSIRKILFFKTNNTPLETENN
ncbi:hypothetical protein EB796_024942 [Bugula neritina]|uniref:Uncharacterized protein n=1 Tax=Bugula neritina TaxID=10212 RepID=A0A7J7IS28_BUGNE|nr:hypothetical protein EB796_024942 [Bugula neritina]